MNRIEHAAVVAPEDAARFGPLGVAASVQPVWIRGYASLATFVPARRLGPARHGRIYPWGDLARGGAFLLFGSDLPSSGLHDPIMGIFGASARQFASGDVFTPEQQVDADLALRAYTENPAVAIGWGDRLGRIAAGYEADMVLLDHDPRTGAKSLADDPVRGLWVAGTARRPNPR
jgi:predicted amidohydrolase YtcJ